MSVAVGCSTPTDANPSLTLATTTSTQDSGLLDVLVPLFTKETGIEVKVVAVGSGQALEIGRRGDADVLLTHAPEAEQRFMSDGHGESRREVMYNDFVLVGPKDDPAHVQGTDFAGAAAIVDALRQIAAAKATFVSRGDESGTHMKEKAIWEKATVTPQGDWYLSAGSGMAATLRLASERRGYVLADRGTFLSQQEQPGTRDPRRRGRTASQCVCGDRDKSRQAQSPASLKKPSGSPTSCRPQVHRS